MAEEPKSSPPGWQHLPAFLSEMTGQQRKLILYAGVAVAATLAGFVWLIGQTKFTVLYSGLKPADAQSLASRLGAKNILYELSPDGGTLKVDADKLDAARLETAAQGLPHNARLGFEIFDTPNWAGSDFTEKVNYQRALEGELERTLQTMSEVEAVRVHLVMAEHSLFVDRTREAKAAVVLKTRGGRLTDEAQRAIPQLIASAVEGLQPDNVTVIDADSQKPMLRHNRGAGATSQEDEELARAVIQTLEPVVGADHVRASVHREYDTASISSVESTYDPKSAVPVDVQRTEEGASGSAPGGIPGTASNIPGAKAAAGVAATATGDQQTAKSEKSTYAVNHVTRTTTQPAGKLRRVTASVLVDDAVEMKEESGKSVATRRKRTPEELKQFEQLANGVLGLDSARGDVLTVANMSFQETPTTIVTPPGKVEDLLRTSRPWLPVLRQVGVGMLFLLVYFMMLRPIKKQLMAAFRKPLGSGVSRSLAGGTSALSGGSTTRQIEPGMESNDSSAKLNEVKRIVVDKIRHEPREAGKMLAAWMEEAPNGAKS